MEAKTKKYIKIGSIAVAGIFGIFAIYKGGKYLIEKYKPGDTGGSDKVITLSDGSNITVSDEQAKKPDNEDIKNLNASLQKWVVANKISQTSYNAIINKSKNLTKYEVQKLMFLLDKGNPSVTGHGFSVDEIKTFLQLLKSIAQS